MAWKYIKCPECGKMVLSNDNHVKLHHRAPKSPRVNPVDTDSLIVLYDPLPFDEGGFRKGAAISREQAKCMCGIGSFTDGMILEDRDKIQYQAARDYTGKQQLVRLTT